MSGEQRQRVAAYAVIRDALDRVLLVQAGPPDGYRWFLPGGGVEFGEHPEDAVRREVREETGQEIGSLRLDDVLSEVGSSDDGAVHQIRVVYRASVVGTQPLRGEIDGSSVDARWVLVEDARSLDLVPFVRTVLEHWITK